MRSSGRTRRSGPRPRCARPDRAPAGTRASKRDFPMPASPTTKTTCPWPARVASNASSSAASSARRPASGVSPRSARASSGPRIGRAPITSNTRTGSLLPRMVRWPRSRVSKKSPASRQVASEITIDPGAASDWSRDARFVVSPIAVYSMRRSFPMRPTTTTPVWMPIRTCRSISDLARISSRNRASAR